MDDRSASAAKRSDPFEAADAMSSDGALGESLFVINLCAANMPQAIDPSSVRAWGIAGLDAYKLYQVSRMEDGRTRYRVRLGFFTTEADAELVLQSVRGKFATAFTSGLGDEDLKHACGHLKKPLQEIREIQDIQRTGRYRIPKFAPEDLPAETSATTRQPVLKVTPTIARAASAMLSTEKAPAAQKKPKANDELVEFEWTPDRPAAVHAKHEVKPEPKAAVKPAQFSSKPASPSKPASSTPGSLTAKAPTPTASKPAAHAAQPMSKPAVHSQPTVAKFELTATTPPPSKSPAAPGRPNQPYHAAAGRSIPDHGLSLAADSAARAPKPSSASAATNLPRPLVSAAALSKLRTAAAQPRNAPTVIPTLDTTQTIRTLTKKEIEDANAPKWYVVQLAISDHPANLDTMPRLDIFQAYCLYSVAVMENNIIRHALRLGFFSEQVSAEAVMGYVKTFFGEPSIERISDSEQKRFGESFALREPPPAPVEPAKSPAQVVALDGKRPANNPLASAGKPARSSIQSKSSSKYAAPAVKRSAPLAAKKTSTYKSSHRKASSAEIDEARLLGLSETAIRRVERNPSLLSRLVDKLTK